MQQPIVLDFPYKPSAGGGFEVFQNPEGIRLLLDQVIQQVADLKEAVAEAVGRYGAWLVDLNSPGLTLNYPLFVLVEASPEEVIARSPELRVVARGQSEEEAILAFKESVVALYHELKAERRDRLGLSMQALQSAITTAISERTT